MSQVESNSANFSVSREDDVAPYRPLSALAVIALVFGLLSFVALVHPLLWLVPGVAVLIALLAARRIAQSELGLSGRSFALISLALALFFGAWAVSKYVARRQILYRQARAHCEHWLELVRQGRIDSQRLYEAYELHLEFERRQAPRTNLESIYGSTSELPAANNLEGPSLFRRDPKQDFRWFWSQSPQREFLRYGDHPGTVLRFDRSGAVYRQFVPDLGIFRETVELYYTFQYEEGGLPQTIPIIVVMRRQWYDKSQQHWFVFAVAKTAS